EQLRPTMSTYPARSHAGQRTRGSAGQTSPAIHMSTLRTPAASPSSERAWTPWTNRATPASRSAPQSEPDPSKRRQEAASGRALARNTTSAPRARREPNTAAADNHAELDGPAVSAIADSWATIVGVGGPAR